MKYPIRILIVEDCKEWRLALYEYVLERFRNARHYHAPHIDSAENGDQALQRLKSNKGVYDLVLLDVNLSEGAVGAPGPHGLDVLEEIGNGKSAFFAVLCTAAATDQTLAEQYGPDRAAVIQVQLQCEAAKCFPSERIRVINKPLSGAFDKGWASVKTALDGVITVFEMESALRYVFRPLRDRPGWWELRWDGGRYFTIADKAGLPELHYILRQVDCDGELSVVEMMSNVQQNIQRPRSGGVRGAEAAIPGSHSKECVDYRELFAPLKNRLLSVGLGNKELDQLHAYLGTSQWRKLGQDFGRAAGSDIELGALANRIASQCAEAENSRQVLPGTVRLIKSRKGAELERRNKNHDAMLDAFKHQWSRIQGFLNEVGLEPMAQHFFKAIDRGKRNPGRSSYNIGLAVRWLLD